MTRRGIAAIVLVAIIVVAAIAGYGWYQDRRVKRAENELALSTARALSEAFSRMSALKVAELNGEAVARVETPSAGGILKPSLTIRAPYKVQYFVELRGVDGAAYRWNAGTRTMSVDLPDVTAEQPSIDLAQAAMDFDGVFVSRNASARLQREGGRRMAVASTRTALRPDNIAKARAAAKRAVSDMLAAPLRAAGHGDVTIVVRFPDETRALSREHWDTTRSIEEVMADHR